MTAKQTDDQYTEAETIERREAALRRMLATPPKQQKEMVRQPKDRPAKPRSRAKTKAA
jgi:hypothetical protein